MGELFQPTHLLLIFFVLLMPVFAWLPVICFWQIFKKSGFHPALSFVFLIPLVNLGLLIWFAFSPWPALEKKN